MKNEVFVDKTQTNIKSKWN